MFKFCVSLRVLFVTVREIPKIMDPLTYFALFKHTKKYAFMPNRDNSRKKTYYGYSHQSDYVM